MAIRYQADNDLRVHIISAVRRRGPAIDFQTAKASGLHGIDDLTVLHRAASENRILVSHDKRTYLAALINEGVTSPGIFLVIPQNAPIQQVAESLILAWAASEPDEWVNCVTKIPF